MPSPQGGDPLPRREAFPTGHGIATGTFASRRRGTFVNGPYVTGDGPLFDGDGFRSWPIAWHAALKDSANFPEHHHTQNAEDPSLVRDMGQLNDWREPVSLPTKGRGDGEIARSLRGGLEMRDSRDSDMPRSASFCFVSSFHRSDILYE